MLGVSDRGLQKTVSDTCDALARGNQSGVSERLFLHPGLTPKQGAGQKRQTRAAKYE